jgi:hypothetical protein
VEIAPTDSVVVAPSVISRELSGEMVLLDLESGVYYGLDAIGTRVWQLLMQRNAVADICTTLLDEYNVAADVLRDDVSRLVGELCDKGLVTRQPA